MKKMKSMLTVVAVCVCSAFIFTGCQMSDFTELFMGRDADSIAAEEGSENAGGTTAATGEAVQIEDYDATQLVDLIDYNNLEIDCKATDDEIQDEIDAVLDENPIKVKEGKAENGMTVNIDYSGKLNGKKFDGGTAKDTTIKLGESGMIPGFDDGIIGMEVGEKKDVELTFPENYHSEDLAGKKTVFTMKLNYIEKTPTFNDEFVKENTEYASVEAFKDAKRIEISDSKEQQARQSGALEKVVGESTVKEVPPTLLLAEKEMLRAQTENQMKMYGMTLEEALEQQGMSMEDFEAYLEQNAQTMAESELIMEAIAIQENVDLSQQAVDAFVDEMLEKSASSSETGEKMTVDELKENYANVYGNSMPFDRYMRSSMIYSRVSEIVGNAVKIIR
ncbi:MAG: trigger factor [Eubacterium sp.]|nr:trigger factor [Eubacterium sp.]